MTTTRRIDPKHLYIGIEVSESFFVATAYTTAVVYWVTSGRLQGMSAHFAVLLTAQIPVGFGAALTFGAQEAWLADETGETELTPVFLRATQLGLAGVIAGSILSGFLASVGLNVPFLVSGGLTGALAITLLFVMSETNFRPPRSSVSAASVTRQAWDTFAGQVRQTHRAIVVVPGLVLLLAMLFFLGMWNESFDRLWGAYLLKDIKFPHPFGLGTVGWFSVFAVAAAVAGLGSTEWANRRTSKLGPGSIVTTLLALTIASAVGVAAMAASHGFVFAVVAYLAVVTMRPVFSPLITGWVVGRVDSSVRATALSATDMFDSGGQIAGGPVIGAIGVLATIRVALLAGAAALAPAAGLLVAATRRVRVRADAARRPGTDPAPDVITPDLGQQA